MKRNIVETVLGAIVLVIAIGFFIYGTSKTDAGQSDGYTITAQFTDIGSLGEGDNVKISGVKVGTVSGIALDPVLYNAVVSMVIQNDVKLPYDTAARISSVGLLGGTYLALDVGGEEDVLAEGDAIEITQSAQNLEQLLGKFIFSLQDSDDDEDSTDTAE